MLTQEQEKWIAHLSDQDRVSIYPFDPLSPQIFEAVKKKIQAVLGTVIRVEHRGATGLGISGQDEIDVYVPVPENQFDTYLASLSTAFQSPRSHYPGERARFVTFEKGKHVDIFLINENGSGWLDGVMFENYLRLHPQALDQYRILKEAGDGLTTRKYYRKKIEFINEILAIAVNQIE
jgi:GrpB-like predicted nucleotidyltransferase (UPF0157 family)